MTWQARASTLTLLLVANFAAGDVIPAPWGIVVVLAALVTAMLYYRGFWRAAAGGLIGGAVAGLLILGPGFRLAMRAVALMDPVHPEEFTLEGTVFIVIGIGGVLGAIQGATAHLARRAFGIDSAVIAGLLLATYMMVELTFFAGELSQEIFDLGLGAWVNIPLFGLIALGYGIAAMAVADRVESSLPTRRPTDRAKVAA
jgi:hypothetical protein